MARTKLVWRPRAQAELRQIGDYIAKDSPKNARDFIKRLKTAAKRLKMYPESGWIVEDLQVCNNGEIVSEVTPHLGYLHRCAEKIGENVTPIQFIPYTDRMDYLAGMNMNLGYSLAVEKLCGMKIPEKAQVIRVIIAELNRIASHLVGMGAYGLDLGTFSPFLYAFREREMILDLFEEVCGARLTYSYITIGGVHDDLPEGWVGHCQKFLDYLKPRIPEYHALLTTNHIFVKRTANIGNLSKALAVAYGCTGPMLRG